MSCIYVETTVDQKEMVSVSHIWVQLVPSLSVTEVFTLKLNFNKEPWKKALLVQFKLFIYLHKL